MTYLIKFKFLFSALMIGLIFNTAYANNPDNDLDEYEVTKSFYELSQKNTAQSKATINIIDKYLENLKTLTESSMTPKKKAVALHQRLNKIDQFVWNNSSHMPRILFKYVNNIIKRSRIHLARYQRHAKNPQIRDATNKSEYWLSQAKEDILWAGYIVYGVKKMASFF